MNIYISFRFVGGIDLVNENAFVRKYSSETSESCNSIMIDGDEGVDVRGDVQGTKGHRSGSVLIVAGSNDIEYDACVLGKSINVNLAGGASIEPSRVP